MGENKKKSCLIMNIIVPANQGLHLKKCKKTNIYLDFATKLRKLQNIKGTVVPFIIGELRTVLKILEKKVWRYWKYEKHSGRSRQWNYWLLIIIMLVLHILRHVIEKLFSTQEHSRESLQNKWWRFSGGSTILVSIPIPVLFSVF